MPENKINKKGSRFAIGTYFVPEESLGVLKVTGEDASEFLQGQFSQDLLGGPMGEARYGFWLNRKGRVEGDAIVIRLAADLCRVFSFTLSAEALIARFDQFLVADDVEMVDESDLWRGWRVLGPGLESWVQRDADEAQSGEYRWMDSPRILPGAAVLVSQTDPVWPKDWEEGTPIQFERARVTGGVARVSVDLGVDDIPQEAGMDLEGVSYRKGCYLGQEVMARIQTTGRVRRRLVRVRGVGAAPEGRNPLEISQGGKPVGTLRSRVSAEDGIWIGLAMVNLSSADLRSVAALSDDQSSLLTFEDESKLDSRGGDE